MVGEAHPTNSFGKLPAADRDDNFQLVAVRQHLLGELPARNDLAVAFQRNALAAQLHLFEQCGNADRHIEMARFAVD